MTITRNEGVSGLTGTTGWYFHAWNGATPEMNVYVTQLPPGQSLVFATRCAAAARATRPHCIHLPAIFLTQPRGDGDGW